MSEPFVYDPRCILCKDPFGAVTCSTAVTFRTTFLTYSFNKCFFIIFCDTHVFHLRSVLEQECS